METVEVVTKNGYKAYLRSDLTYGQYLQVQEILTSRMSVDPNTVVMDKIPASIMIEANKKALEFLLVKIIDPKGNELPKPIEALYNLPREDGVELMTKANKITSASFISEKKGGK